MCNVYLNFLVCDTAKCLYHCNCEFVILLFISREGCLNVKEPPGYSIEYTRRGRYTMYLVTHRDKVHREYPYILAHYHQVEDCYAEESKSAAGVMEVNLHFKNKHHDEVEVCSLSAEHAVMYVHCSASSILSHDGTITGMKEI